MEVKTFEVRGTCVYAKKSYKITIRLRKVVTTLNYLFWKFMVSPWGGIAVTFNLAF